jgi:hypothetical protein
MTYLEINKSDSLYIEQNQLYITFANERGGNSELELTEKQTKQLLEMLKTKVK